MNADARRLVALAAAAGLEVDYHEVPQMLHDFPLLPIPEARKARMIIKAVLNS